MGEAKRRGTFEQRKEKAIKEGKNQIRPFKPTKSQIQQMRNDIMLRQGLLNAIRPKKKMPEVLKYVDENRNDQEDSGRETVHEDQINPDGKKDPG